MAVLWAAASLALRHADHPPSRTGEHPPWNPSLPALDLLVPVIDLGQAGYRRLRGGRQWPAAAVILPGGSWQQRWQRARNGSCAGAEP